MDTALSLARPRNRLLQDVVHHLRRLLRERRPWLRDRARGGPILRAKLFGVTDLVNLSMAVIAGLGEPGIGTALVRLASQPGMTAAGDR